MIRLSWTWFIEFIFPSDSYLTVCLPTNLSNFCRISPKLIPSRKMASSLKRYLPLGILQNKGIKTINILLSVMNRCFVSFQRRETKSKFQIFTNLHLFCWGRGKQQNIWNVEYQYFHSSRIEIFINTIFSSILVSVFPVKSNVLKYDIQYLP